MGDRVARALELHHRASELQDGRRLVFCQPHTGRPCDPSKMRDRFSDAMRSAGYEHMIGRDGGGIVFHSLRHTFGTQMASAGIPLVAIKEWMGHADIQTTMIYAKWGKDRAADRALVDAAFVRPTASNALTSAVDSSLSRQDLGRRQENPAGHRSLASLAT